MDRLYFFLLVIGIPLGSVVIVFVVRHYFDHAALSKNNGAAGMIFSMVGTLYAFLLAFVGIVAWQNMSAADAQVGHEAGLLGDLVRDVELLGDASMKRQGQLCNYAKAVIKHEWKAMANGGESQEVSDIVDDMFSSFKSIDPKSAKEINIHAEMLTRLNDLSEHRRTRLLSADSKVPGLMWALLGLGAVVTLGFCYFIGVEAFRAHALMVIGLSTMIGLTMYLIIAIDHPFTGILKVEPDAFEFVLGHEKRCAQPL